MTVHLVKGRYVNSYIIEQGKELCVIDVALRGEKYVMGYITQTLERPLEDVSLVICTHGDPDHSGGVLALAKHCNAKVGFPYATHSTLQKSANDPTGFIFRFSTSLVEMFRPRMWSMYVSSDRDVKAKTLPTFTPESSGSEHKSAKEVEGDEGEVAMEDAVDVSEDRKQADYRLKHKKAIPGFPDWTVIHTPGHSWDSCCFYSESTGELMSGDTLLGSKKKGQVVVASIYSNPIQMRNSLKRLRRMNLTTIYPAHGSPISGEGLLDHLAHWPAKS
ncbi:MAG: hypothetical protein COA99_13040 [Moraxellaceae bacterium]|nr:MAG: hypothetical protein COA99_13040 [Moraxellaceae bacterium]